MAQWGSDTNNESKPRWKFLERDLANVFATPKGWVRRLPWVDDILVAIGGLSTKLGTPTVTSAVFRANVVNRSTQTLGVDVLFNEPVTVSGTPTLQAIGTMAANVTLSYVAGKSTPNTGKLVFENTNVNLSSATGEHAFTVNTTSVLSGWNNIVDAATSNVVANSMTAVASMNVQTISAITSLVTPNVVNATAQTLQVTVTFDKPLTVTGTPTVRAIGTGTANQTLSYAASLSSPATGVLVFNVVADLSAVTVGSTFTVNSTSVLVGWDGIKDATYPTYAVANTIVGTSTISVEQA